MSKQQSSNDERSKVKNPEHSAYEADRTNRQKLGHANAPPVAAPAVQPPVPPKK